MFFEDRRSRFLWKRRGLARQRSQLFRSKLVEGETTIVDINALATSKSSRILQQENDPEPHLTKPVSSTLH